MEYLICYECGEKDKEFKICTYSDDSTLCIDCYNKHLCPQCLEDFVIFCYENNLCINDARKVINEHIEKIKELSSTKYLS